MIPVRRVQQADEFVMQGLCALLIDAVHGGASVGFLAPLTPERARHYWEQVFAALGPGLVLWVAESAGELVGSVQLAPCGKENGRHRADVQKLFVLSAHRGRGISTTLMHELETHAAAQGRTLLVLDTIAGSHAETVYQHLGWRRVGEIPEYAAMPDGELRATVYYYKRIAS